MECSKILVGYLLKCQLTAHTFTYTLQSFFIVPSWAPFWKYYDILHGSTENKFPFGVCTYDCS